MLSYAVDETKCHSTSYYKLVCMLILYFRVLHENSCFLLEIQVENLEDIDKQAKVLKLNYQTMSMLVQTMMVKMQKCFRMIQLVNNCIILWIQSKD